MALTPFTYDEVERILLASENATLPDGRKRGHSGARHVAISNADLAQRMHDGDATIAGIAMYTAFLTFRDQIRTGVEVLNAPQSRTPLESFYADANRKSCTLKDVVLTNSVPIRMAVAGGTHTYPDASFATMVLYKDRSRPRSLHVLTIFARLAILGVDP